MKSVKQRPWKSICLRRHKLVSVKSVSTDMVPFHKRKIDCETQIEPKSVQTFALVVLEGNLMKDNFNSNSKLT